MALERPSFAEDDFAYWKLTYEGIFSLKSVYAMILCMYRNAASALSDPPGVWWKKLWGLPILLMFTIFLWKLLHDGLPLGGKIRLRGMDVDPSCYLCYTE